MIAKRSFIIAVPLLLCVSCELKQKKLANISESGIIEIDQFLKKAVDRNEIPAGVKKRIGLIGKMALKGVRPVDEDTDGTLLAGAIKDHQHNFDVHQSALEITFIDDTAESGFNTLDFSPFQHIDAFDTANTVFYSFSGWFDGGYPHSAVKRFMTLNHPQNKLILGPWTHGGRFTASPFNSGKSRFNFYAELMKFFDYYLKFIYFLSKGELYRVIQ